MSIGAAHSVKELLRRRVELEIDAFEMMINEIWILW